MPEVDMSEVTESDNTAMMDKKADTALAYPIDDFGGLTGEVTSDDTRVPTLNIVHGVGPLSEHFDPGSLVYNKELVVAEGSKEGTKNPIEIVVVAAHKDYLERVEWGSESLPRSADTEEEVRALGGTTQYNGDERPSWDKRLTCLILIKGAEGAPCFDYHIGGEWWAPAMWVIKGPSQWRAAGTHIVTAAKMGLRNFGGLPGGRWSLSVRRQKIGDNFVYVPAITSAGKNLAEFVHEVRELGLSL